MKFSVAQAPSEKDDEVGIAVARNLVSGLREANKGHEWKNMESRMARPPGSIGLGKNQR